MAGSKGIVNAFRGLGEAGKTAIASQGGELIHPASQNLMDIGLVPDVKNQPIPLSIKDIVDGQCKLDRAQVGCQMAAGLRDIPQQKGPNLSGQCI